MVRRLAPLVAVAGALAIVHAASGAYPTPFAQQGASLVTPDGAIRYVVDKATGNNTLVAIQTSSGKTVKSQTISGAFGIPMLTQNGYLGGLYRDGSAFVLQNVGVKSTSTFLILDTKDLSTRGTVTLKGTFGFDALSPDASKLYLIQHRSTQDIQHYIVRAYDLNEHTLLRGRIADKTQKSWVMQGFAVSRTTTPDGRWAYTLYANPGGYPFVHALDTVRGVAHCIGLPWKTGDQGPVYNFGLGVRGKYLVVRWQDGRIWRLINRANWRVSTP